MDPNYLPPHYREEYRLAIDTLVEEDLEGYYQFLQKADVVDFLSSPEIQYIQESVQLPQESVADPRLLETGGDGSSDTYWPLHSDLDAPGLDLGWPQMQHFIGPTEVTTLVNPPETDMPSIKDQARRLIKNAQQVIAIVMDMFTDVDIFHDILNAAMRNVAVYVLLDEQNTHHFINMVSNCRVNLQSIQFLRVRTVSGMTYHCRSGKSFKGQMMDRFLLTDCRAVLSGNYSFMWSFEKIHRCMAHLFLGQLVSTFDEEFRILFAQSQPLIIEQMFDPMEEFSLVQSRKYPSERPSLYRDARKFVPPEIPHPEEWPRHSYDERKDVDWRMKPLKKKRESFHGLQDMHGRFPSHQARVDPSFEPSPHRTPMIDNPAFKRHSFAEGVVGRYPFLQQQGIPEPDDHARQFHRQQQPLMGPGKEADYNPYNKFWNQDYLADPYSESALPPEVEPPETFDPVLNYLSSTRNVDFDQGSDKLAPTPDLPYGSPYSRRRGIAQTSPTPPNPVEQKHFFLEPDPGRKDPIVKQGLRDWRISSYLSTYDGKGDEGLPLAPPDVSDPFEEPSYPFQQTAPAAALPMSKIPNVREFKVPVVPRASQMPSYVKNTALEQTKKSPDEPSPAPIEAKRTPTPTPTPTPSESSSTTEGEKAEEAETHKEPKLSLPLRDDSFRRKYNAAIPRCSRLRSSLIFSSLDQQHSSEDNNTTPGDQDEEGDKSEAEPGKTTFASQVFAHRKKARKPIEWSRFIKSATVDNSATDSSATEEEKSTAADKDSSKAEDSRDLSNKLETKESLNLPNAEETSSPSVPHSQPSEAELSTADQPTQPPISMLTGSSFVDMNDPDMRLMFFKELAAKRKAEKAAEAVKVKGPMKAPPELKKQATVEKPDTEEIAVKIATPEVSMGSFKEQATVENAEQKVSSDVCDSGDQCVENSQTAGYDKNEVKNDLNPAPVFEEDAQPNIITDSEVKSSQPEATPPASAEPKLQPSESTKEPKLLNLTEEKSINIFPPSPASNCTPASDIPPNKDTVEVETQSFDSLTGQATLTESSKIEASPLTLTASEDSENPNTGSALEVARSHSPPMQQQETELEASSSTPTPSFSDHTHSESSTKIIPGQSPSSSSPLYTTSELESSSVTLEESTSSSVISPPSLHDAITPSAQSVEEETSAGSPSQAKPESTQPHLDSVSQLAVSETVHADSAHLESDDVLDTFPADIEANTPSLETCEIIDPKASCSQAASEKDVDESEDGSILCVVDEELEDPGSSDDCYSTPPGFLSPYSSLTKPTFDQNDGSSESSSSEIPSPQYFMAETELSPTEQDPSIKVAPLSKSNLARLVLPISATRESCCSPTESVEPDLSPGTEKTLSPLHSPSQSTSLNEHVPADSDETPTNPCVGSCGPVEAIPNVPTEEHQPCKTPESEISEAPHVEQTGDTDEDGTKDGQNEANQEPVISNADEEKTDHTEATHEINQAAVQESAHCEKTNDKVTDSNCSELPEVPSDEVPVSPQSKQARASQSRYHSSTANVLSSSNLRDDTKLLLEQISANSQSRSEASKEVPVTDDEKEDEADKNAKRGKEGGGRPLSRGQPKSAQDREKLLEKIQSMRKERKVYSRFEIAP